MHTLGLGYKATHARDCYISHNLKSLLKLGGKGRSLLRWGEGEESFTLR